MAKRITSYTSTSIGKDKIEVLNSLQSYIKEQLGLSITNQQVVDLAIDRAWAQKDEFCKEFGDHDPDLLAYLQLQAKLKARGRI
jgi:hypothetical protein